MHVDLVSRTWVDVCFVRRVEWTVRDRVRQYRPTFNQCSDVFFSFSSCTTTTVPPYSVVCVCVYLIYFTSISFWTFWCLFLFRMLPNGGAYTAAGPVINNNIRNEAITMTLIGEENIDQYFIRRRSLFQTLFNQWRMIKILKVLLFILIMPTGDKMQ